MTHSFLKTQSLLTDNTNLLTELAAFLTDQCDDDLYVAETPINAIGTHVRHIYDHYCLFLTGLDTQIIDYDNRNRDTQVSDLKAVGIDRLNRTVKTLLTLDDLDMNTPLTISLSTHKKNPAVPTLSTVGRELAFCHSHTVHHMAFIKAIASDKIHNVDPSFAKAPSTLKFERA